jgi:urease accessory protein
MRASPSRASQGLTAMADIAAPALLKLLTFLSPAFPVGAFAYSHGLEWAIDGAVTDAATLRAWVADILERGSAWNDAVLFAAAYRAAAAGDRAALLEVAAVAEALAGSRERHLETMAQGRAFLAALDAWPSAPAAWLTAANGAAYPVAVASAAAGHSIPLAAALPAYVNAFAATLVSVAIRLVPLGQNAGLAVLAALHPLILRLAMRAEKSDLDDLGSATLLSDIAAMRHETQYSRVFRT